MTHAEMVTAIVDHFDSRDYASSRWGRGFSVDQEAGRIEAAEYILRPGGPVLALIEALEDEAVENVDRLYERIQSMNGTQ